MANSLTYIRKGETSRGKVNKNYTYFDYKGRTFIKFRDDIISTSWSESGKLLTIQRAVPLSVAGLPQPYSFKYRDLQPIIVSNPPTKEEMDVYKMLCSGYPEFEGDLSIFLDLLQEGEKLDTDFNTLLRLFQQAEEIYHDTQRSLQTS